MNEFAKQVLIIAKSLQIEITPKVKFEKTVPKKNYKNKIYRALLKISEHLASSYLQVQIDIDNQTRVSWVGTAHEIREILATLLRELAPDEDVCAQPWYEEYNNTSRPTQRQRVRYILEQKQVSTNEKKVMENIGIVENMASALVRATYSRASNAAHTFEGRKEVLRILKYFEAFVHDLLDIDES